MKLYSAHVPYSSDVVIFVLYKFFVKRLDEISNDIVRRMVDIIRTASEVITAAHENPYTNIIG